MYKYVKPIHHHLYKHLPKRDAFFVRRFLAISAMRIEKTGNTNNTKNDKDETY